MPLEEIMSGPWNINQGISEDLGIHHIVVNDWDRGVDADQNVVLVSVPSVLSPDLAPPGKHVLHAYLPGTEPYELWTGLDRRSAEYKNLKSERSEVRRHVYWHNMYHINFWAFNFCLYLAKVVLILKVQQALESWGLRSSTLLYITWLQLIGLSIKPWSGSLFDDHLVAFGWFICKSGYVEGSGTCTWSRV